MAIKKAKFIAHRGYSGIAPENSIPAFLEAAENHFWGIECDVWETKSKELLIMHDDSIKRMCGVKRSIRDINRTNRVEYPLINGKNIDLYKTLYIPTLEEYMEQLGESIPVIELKSLPKYKNYKISEDNIHKMKKMLMQKDRLKEAFFISFSKSLLLDIKRLIPEAHAMYLIKKASNAKLLEEIKWCSANKIDGMDIKHTLLSEDIIKEAHLAGIQVCVWLVDDYEHCMKLDEMGVDFITTNHKYFE